MDTPSSSSTKSSHVNAKPPHLGSGTIKSPKGLRSSHTLTQDRGQASTSRSRPTTPAESVPKASQSSGLKAHLHHLLPRHALFHVQVQIHQLSSVPLVHGQFAVRWKFKHVHTPPPSLRSAVLQKAKEHSTGKGKEKAVVNGEESDDSASLEGDNAVNSGEDSLPSVIVSSDDHSRVSTTTSETSAPSRFEQYLTADWLPHSILSPISARHSTPANSPSLSSTPVEAYAQARGRTQYIKLKDHNISWEHTVNIVVQMDVDRDSSYLLPNELKLVVMQEVIPGDPDSPHNPRLGALYLNLAEYAAAGPVTRRYLLRESKTNATLKLTIQLEHVGGETSYNAPPLPKGEILTGIAGFLESDFYRVRPGAFHLYNELPGKVTDGVPFDVSTLPLACGPRATETLIEAIFNPVPTTSKKESPFTYYQPEAKKGGPGVEGLNEMKFNKSSTNHGEGASVYSTESSGVETEHTNTSSTTSGHESHGSNERHEVAGADKKRWWTKIGVSRPATPST